MIANRKPLLTEQEHWEGEVAKSTEAIVSRPNDVQAYLRRGFAHRMLGEYEAALADYDRAIALAPGNANAYGYRSIVYEKLHRTDRAAEDARAVSELTSDDGFAPADDRGVTLTGSMAQDVGLQPVAGIVGGGRAQSRPHWAVSVGQLIGLVLFILVFGVMPGLFAGLNLGRTHFTVALWLIFAGFVFFYARRQAQSNIGSGWGDIAGWIKFGVVVAVMALFLSAMTLDWFPQYSRLIGEVALLIGFLVWVRR